MKGQATMPRPRRFPGSPRRCETSPGGEGHDQYLCAQIIYLCAQIIQFGARSEVMKRDHNAMH
jgi:hypothetical protein